MDGAIKRHINVIRFINPTTTKKLKLYRFLILFKNFISVLYTKIENYDSPKYRNNKYSKKANVAIIDKIPIICKKKINFDFIKSLFFIFCFKNMCRSIATKIETIKYTSIARNTNSSTIPKFKISKNGGFLDGSTQTNSQDNRFINPTTTKKLKLYRLLRLFKKFIRTPNNL